MKDSEKLKPSFAFGRITVASAALCWALAGVCIKSIPWNPMAIFASRGIIGILIFGIIKKSFVPHLNIHTFMAGFMMAVTGMLYIVSTKLTTAATAIVLQYTAPIFVLLYSVIFQKRKVKLFEIIIVSGVFAGCILSFADGLDFKMLLGNTLALLSGITYASQIIIFNDKRANPTESMYICNLLSAVIGLPFMLFGSGMVFNKTVIIWVLVLGFLQYGLANILYSVGCQQLDKLEVSLFLTLEPICCPIPVWIVCGEKPGTLAFIGFAVVIISVTLYIVYPSVKSRRNKSHI